MAPGIVRNVHLQIRSGPLRHVGRGTRRACKPCSVVGKTPVSNLYCPSAVLKLLICARAAVTRALSNT